MKLNRTQRRRIALFLMLLLSITAGVAFQATAQTASCEASPDLVGQCFIVRGRLMLTNGNPTVRIWRVGTKRIFGVLDANGNVFNDLTGLPLEIQKLFPLDNPDRTEIFGDYTVCPFDTERSGWMQDVCIARAENLVVRPR
jgi:hypothetical protein